MHEAANVLAVALDPVRLARTADIEPDDWQAALLRDRSRNVILNCSRQSGKSLVSSLLVVDEAVSRAPSLVLLLAPSQRQAVELLRTVKAILASIGELAPRTVQDSALSIELSNGSRVCALPGSEATVRGFSGPALLVVDEASRIEDGLFAALRPMLAVSRGRMILLSTPFGKRGVFYETWVNGGTEWHKVRLPATECPRIDRDWLENERRSMPAHEFAQEYLCEFADSNSQFVATDILRAALSDDPPLFPHRQAA
jgi:phage FluMu gp28-like protein